MRTVIVRDEQGDTEITYEEADIKAGSRLDRRKKYAFVFGFLCESYQFTEPCSGCFEGGENMGLAGNYKYDEKAHCYIGSGCDECGYTGKKVNRFWAPI